MTPSEQNAAARAWAETDPAGAQQAICSAGSLWALRRAYVALRREQPNAGRRRVREVIRVIRFAVRALARGSEFQPAGGELRIIELGWRGNSTLIVGGVAEHLAGVPVDAAGLSALAVLHARQPQTVAPDVTRHPHAGGLEAFQRGRGAPWPLRIAYETLIDVPAAARNGGIARLEYPLRGAGDATLQAMLYPKGRLKLSRDWGRFLAALEVVDRFSVPADGGMSAWLPIRVRSVPVRTGGVLRLDVSLPPGSDKGPRILRRVLRRLGARSYPQWRAWLALAYLWDRSAVNGHWVRATRPRLARDSGGRLVDATGAVMLDKRGAPVTKWKDRRAVLLDAEGRPVPTAGEAAREHNPDARLHPWLTEADIVALGYPPERGLSASARSMRKARVLEDLAAFEAEGLIVFEAHPDGRRWRVLPPDTDPA